MAEFDLNLSTRPFPAYRLMNIALAVLLVVIVAVSSWQAVGFRRYSRLARSIRTQEQDSRVEAEALGKRVADLESRLDRPEATAKLTEISFLNHLIQRKSFSWTRLWAILEDMIPPDVHLESLTPEIELNGPVTLRINVQARSIADVSVFIHRLEESSVFEKIIVSAANEKQDPNPNLNPNPNPNAMAEVDITMSAVYYPQRETR
jgi:Tfp pilus assembly protein PilN